MSMVAYQPGESVHVDQLGALVWYTVRSISQPTRSELFMALSASQLPPTLMPKPIAPSDALRRAVKDIGNLPTQTLSPTKVVRLLFREAPDKDQDYLTYHLVRETGTGDAQGSKNSALDYQDIAQVSMHKKLGGRLHVQLEPGFTPEPDSPEEAALRAIEQKCHFNRSHYDSQSVRTIVTRALAVADPVSVRPAGGVYFVSRSFEDRVNATKAFLSLIGGNSRLYNVPVINDEDARTMVVDSVEAEVGAEAQRVIESLKKLLSSGKVTTETTTAALRSFGDLRGMTERYETLLQSRIDGARAALEVAEQQARAILVQV